VPFPAKRRLECPATKAENVTKDEPDNNMKAFAARIELYLSAR